MDEEATINITLPFKYVPVELIHHIQSLLPKKEAARTCVLSKSWLHAWSTIPTLSIQLHLDIDKLSLPSPVENWFQVLASGNCLKELSLTICGKKLNKNEVGCLMIPDAIFSCENLNTISLRADKVELYKVRMNINPVIKCSFLRVLELENVCISETELHNLFSSCSLLEKITLNNCQQMEIIKVTNLRFLRELRT
ncbi:putative F-box/LRR-repeat protein isoform X2 [Tanacetum coccineum]